MKQFFSEHWGDLIALYILHMGLFIAVYFHTDSDISHIGESLILTGMATLRFKGVLQNGSSAKTI